MQRLMSLLFVFLGIIVALFILPSTRWMVKNDLNFLTFGKGLDEKPENLVIYNIYDETHEWDKPDKVDVKRLGHLGEVIRLTQNSGLRYRSQDYYLTYIRHYCKNNPQDKVARAFYCTVLAESAQIINKDKESVKFGTNITKKKERCRELLSASEGMDRYDPQNLLFPALRAAAMVNLDQVAGAKAELLRASTMSDINNYSRERTQALISNYEGKYGYRGEAVRAGLTGSTSFGELSVMRSLATWASKQSDMELTIATMKIADVMTHRSSYLIGLLVAKSMTISALGLKSRTDGKAQSYESILAKAKVMEPEAQKHGFSIVNSISSKAKFFQKGYPYDLGLNNNLYNENPRKIVTGGAPALIISLFVFIPLFSLLQWLFGLKADHTKVSRLAPHLVWFLIPAIADNYALPFFLVGGLLVVASLVVTEANAKWVRIAGYIFAIFVALMAYAGWSAGVLVGLIYVIADFMSHKTFKPFFTAAFTWVNGLFLVALFPLACMNLSNVLFNEAATALTCVLVAFAFFPKAKTYPKWLPVVAMGFYIVGYMGTIAWRIQDNNQWKAELAYYHGEGDRFRAQYEIK
jgi:hypothetical protein